MTYRFRRKESVRRGITRVATDELDSARLALKNAGRHFDQAAVHEARKSVKKTRAILRLAQPKPKGASSRADRRLQRVGRALSQVRDADVLLDTFDLLRDRYPARLRGVHFAAVRRELAAMSARTRAHALRGEDVRAAARELDAARRGVRRWKPQHTGFHALEPGLASAFRRARRALARAEQRPSDESFHTWRRRVKTHWYQMRLLEKIDPRSMKTYARRLKRLEQLLGDDHNLTVLKSWLGEVGDLRAHPDRRQLLGVLIDRLQSQLRLRARSVGKAIYASRPRTFARRLERGWSRWRKKEKRRADILRPAARDGS